MLRGWKCVLAVAVAAFAIGCMSPTLPLPPPAQPTETAGPSPGMVHLHGPKGSIPPGATVIIYNLAPQASENLDDTKKVTAVLAHDDGSWDADVWAIAGDVVTIFDIEEGEWSPSIQFQIN